VKPATAFSCVLLLAAWTPALAGEEGVKGYTHRAEIGNAGGGTAAIEFYPGVRIASEPVVADAAGKAVASKVLLNQDRGKLLLVFDASGGGAFTLHYGGQGSAERPQKRYEPAVSLLMEVRPKPPGPVPMLAAMRKLVSETADSVQGMTFVQNIHHGYNPFGPSERFITIYRGELNIAKDGTYRVFTVSSDASFVLVDGKEAFSWPGTHNANEGRYGEFGEDMTLKAGTHTIEYYHAKDEGQPFMCLGWRKPGEKTVQVVPPDAFTHTTVATVGKAARKDGAPAARFTWSQDDLLLFDQFQYALYTFTNRTADKVDSVLWDFGDGVTATENEVKHVFTGTPPFRTRLTVKAGDKTDACEIDVPLLTPMSNSTILDRQVLKRHVNVLAKYPFAKLPVPALQRAFELIDVLEQPLLAAPVAEVVRDRVTAPGVQARTREILAKAYAVTAPEKAIPLLEGLGDSRDTMTAAAARIDLLELYLHRLRDFDKVRKLADVYMAVSDSKSLLHRAARVKVGDVYLVQGGFKKAEEIYRQVQDMSFKGMDPREVDVRQGAHAEAVNSYLLDGNLRIARERLLQWEADFPVSKITGDFILLSSRYYEAIGDARRALDDMESLLKINPLTPHLPQIEFRMGNCYRMLGEKDKAIKLYEKVIKDYPKNPVVHDAAAALYGLR